MKKNAAFDMTQAACDRQREEHLARQRDDLVALMAAAALYGNCRIETTAYTGTGTYGPEHPNHLIFHASPLFILVYRPGGSYILMRQGCAEATVDTGSAAYPIHVSWRGNAVSWYSERNASIQLNSGDQTYNVTAVFSAA